MQELNKGKEPPEFMSTHPSSKNRIIKLNEWINTVIIDYPPIKYLKSGEPCWARTSDPFLKRELLYQLS